MKIPLDAAVLGCVCGLSAPLSVVGYRAYRQQRNARTSAVSNEKTKKKHPFFHFFRCPYSLHNHSCPFPASTFITVPIYLTFRSLFLCSLSSLSTAHQFCFRSVESISADRNRSFCQAAIVDNDIHTNTLASFLVALIFANFPRISLLSCST